MNALSSAVRTALLMAALIALLAAAGRAVGGAQGMLVFGGVGLVINFVSYFFSDTFTLMAHRARPVTAAQAPSLYRALERLTRRAGLPMPRAFVIPSDSPNAFATGRNPRHAAVAVTVGLLDNLTERQLEAVLAHEVGHVKNRDVLIGTMAAAAAGLIAAVGHALQWGLMWGGRSRDDDRGGGLTALAWVLVAPVVAMLVQLAISRSREYAADTTGAALCGDGPALAEALEVIDGLGRQRPYPFAGPATAHLFIINPLHGPTASLLQLLSTHPPLPERVRRLRALA